MITAKAARTITESYYNEPNFQADITKIHNEIRTACIGGLCTITVKVDHPEWIMSYITSLKLAGFNVHPSKYSSNAIWIDW